ncbi:hypothetical protein SteCoe_4566 [Stentor coeruleus]|uniref:Uncharacterized protein n=1 Tax=Stentor coeruleus TaxID=5963 RepID=A0A1R2CUN2_9CILI|nr:hypothetical protein SteCoe_4566 [Stentor coeruleus]
MYLAFSGYLYKVKDLKNAMKQTAKGFIIPILIGCSIDFDYLSIFLMVQGYLVIPTIYQGKFFPLEIFVCSSAILAASLLPLDWDLETDYQIYPYPILIFLELSHTLGLLIFSITNIIIKPKQQL